MQHQQQEQSHRQQQLHQDQQRRQQQNQQVSYSHAWLDHLTSGSAIATRGYILSLKHTSCVQDQQRRQQQLLQGFQRSSEASGSSVFISPAFTFEISGLNQTTTEGGGFEFSGEGIQISASGFGFPDGSGGIASNLGGPPQVCIYNTSYVMQAHSYALQCQHSTMYNYTCMYNYSCV